MVRSNSRDESFSLLTVPKGESIMAEEAWQQKEEQVCCQYLYLYVSKHSEPVGNGVRL